MSSNTQILQSGILRDTYNGHDQGSQGPPEPGRVARSSAGQVWHCGRCRAALSIVNSNGSDTIQVHCLRTPCRCSAQSHTSRCSCSFDPTPASRAPRGDVDTPTSAPTMQPYSTGSQSSGEFASSYSTPYPYTIAPVQMSAHHPLVTNSSLNQGPVDPLAASQRGSYTVYAAGSHLVAMTFPTSPSPDLLIADSSSHVADMGSADINEIIVIARAVTMALLDRILLASHTQDYCELGRHRSLAY
ncbi:hypothetical protein GGR57DRAFT_500880 [Xylariaceae sp. FL1272]|nr:hypothetical protein GGR57DRAFT_500880 [Xylariaceae sp. FL1272]